MWDLPGPGLEPVSPALAGGFLTTAPLGKSKLMIFRKTSLMAIWRVDCPGWGWGSRLQIWRQVRQLYKEITTVNGGLD